MRNITFLKTQPVGDGSGASYEVGRSYSVSDPSADRFVRRGEAVLAKQDAEIVTARILDAGASGEVGQSVAAIPTARLAESRRRPAASPASAPVRGEDDTSRPTE